MTTRLIILLAAALLCWAGPAAGQTIKSLGYNTTNGNIVAATNVTFTNSVGFATNARAATRTNLGGTTVGNSVFTATNAAAAATAIGLGTTDTVSFSKLNAEMDAGSGQSIVFNSPIAFDDVASEDIVEKTRTNLGGTTVGNAVFTATNAAAAAAAIGLGTTNNVVFNDVQAAGFLVGDETNSQIAFEGNSAATTRTNLGLGLPALTNTSNVTTMRALAGSTNTNEPYSGTVALTNTNVLTFSNGVLLKIQ